MSYAKVAEWLRLPRWQRARLISHRPDELEMETSLRAGVLADLESEWGPRQWDATVAVLAECEESTPRERDPQYEMTLAEIGVHFRLSGDRVRQIQEQALRRLRNNREVRDLLESLLDCTPWRPLHKRVAK
jgi:hypothetical protein